MLQSQILAHASQLKSWVITDGAPLGVARYVTQLSSFPAGCASARNEYAASPTPSAGKPGGGACRCVGRVVSQLGLHDMPLIGVVKQESVEAWLSEQESCKLHPSQVSHVQSP